MKKIKTILSAILILVLNNNIQAQKTQKWSSLIRDNDNAWFASTEAKDIAENVLLYQRNIGGWPKNIQMQDPLTEAQKKN